MGTPPEFALADEEKIEELQKNIGALNDKLDEINQAIKEAESRVAASSAEAASIASRVRQLEASRSKIEKDISYTETQIQKTQLEIEKIGYEISDKETRIARNTEALAVAIKELDAMESLSLIELLLAYDNLGDFFNQVQAIETFQDTVQDTVLTLRGLNTELRTKQQAEAQEKQQLESSRKLLSGEREAVASTKSKQQELLTVAQKTEAEQRAYLAQKQQEKQQFESALLEFESELKTLIDPTSFPSARQGVLSWPVDTVRITQQFGGTQFAKNNPHIYGRAMHNGTDFGVPVGSKVYAVTDGVVQASGNTDAYPGCRSWGKWILVKHTNGLSSLYAHLSSILVNEGDSVTKGQNIALSGNTGVSTGPHLHLTLYASQGVQVVKFNEFKPGATGCAATGAATPVAPLEAYLDPMTYLPSL
jgi:murein DD-endopeptidase MepM/ murein hydrolase activator NlpD